MRHRERIRAAVRREPADRTPVDLGSTIATTMTVGAQSRLARYLGLPSAGEAVSLFARRSGTVIPDEAILRRFDADARAVVLGSADGRPERDVSLVSFVDEWGVKWSRPEGGHYINAGGPFYGLDEPAAADAERFDWPEAGDAGRYRGLRERAEALHAKTDYAVVMNLAVGPIHQCQFMRGFGEFLEDLLACPAFAEALLDRVTDFWVEVTKRALEEAGDCTDLVAYGDDLGTQKTTLMRPELYRKMIKPRHKRMAETVKRYGKPILYHTCGSVYRLIPDLIDVGIDVLNPVQVSAAEMDSRRLKREFGRDLAFWGGVDNQKVLPQGTPEDVRREVRRRIEELGEGGGYVAAAAHNIQEDVPPENIVAMFEAALKEE